MSFIIPFLGTILGIIVAIAIVVGIIYYNIRKVVGKSQMSQIITAAKNASDIQMQEYARKKNVSGLTKLLEPEIIRDFPDFNKDLLFSTVEENLRKIFETIESKNINIIKQDESLINIREDLECLIKDYKISNINIEYNDIKFHEHAIKDYRKKDGKATISVSTTLEYYYKTNLKGEKSYSEIKKQTRYTTKFCYIYDETKFDDGQIEYSINCPNCGAPIVGTKNTVCRYCCSTVTAINLKAWRMISYKEDYK